MGKRYHWTPFMADSQINEMLKNSPNKKMGVGTQLLNQVRSNDTVVIVGHCNATTQRLWGKKWGGDDMNLSAKEVVERLVQAGLDKAHNKFELLACSGGANATSFATSLKKELRKKFRHNAQLRAYKQTVSETDHMGRTFASEDRTNRRAAIHQLKSHKV